MAGSSHCRLPRSSTISPRKSRQRLDREAPVLAEPVVQTLVQQRERQMRWGWPLSSPGPPPVEINPHEVLVPALVVEHLVDVCTDELA